MTTSVLLYSGTATNMTYIEQLPSTTNNGSYTFTLPSTLTAGNYLIMVRIANSTWKTTAEAPFIV